MGATSLRFDFKHQLQIAKEVEAFSNSVFTGEHHGNVDRIDCIFYGLTDKNITTFHAIKMLAEAGLVDDALALVRVLGECTINALFVASSPIDVANDYADFSDVRAWVEYRDLLKVAPETVQEITPERANQMKEAYEKAIGRYKSEKDWCALSLFERAKAIDTAVGDQFPVARIIVNSAWRATSAYVHSTAPSIESRVHDEGGVFIIRRRVNAEEQAGVLFTAITIMMLMLAF